MNQRGGNRVQSPRSHCGRPTPWQQRTDRHSHRALSLRRRKSPSVRCIQGHAVKQLERTQSVLLCWQTVANSQLDLQSAHKVVIYKSLTEISSTALDGWQQYFSDVNKNDVTYTIHKNYWSRFHNIYRVTSRKHDSERLGLLSFIYY